MSQRHRAIPVRELLLVVSVVALMATPPLSTGGLGPAGPPRGPAKVVLPLDSGSGSVPPHSPGLPGASPDGEPPIDAPALAAEELAHAVGSVRRVGLPPAPNASAPPPPSPLTPRPAANATVSGVVRDYVTGTALTGVGVVLVFVAGGCGGSVCPFGRTGTNGLFSFTAPPGNYALTASLANYSDNSSVVTVPNGGVVNVGTIRLVPDGVVTGTVVSSAPGHVPVANVSVNAVSRNGAESTYGPLTGPNGTFRLLAPPIADRIDLNPSLIDGVRFEPNFTYAVPPPGRTINVGTVELVAGTEVHLHLIDRVTGRPVGPYTVSTDIACRQLTQTCPLAGPTAEGPNITLYAVPGPTVLHVIPLGYVENITWVRPVPSEPPGTAVSISVNVTPLGAVRVDPGITGGLPSVGGRTVPPNVGGGEFWKGPWWQDVAPNSNITGAGVCSLDGVMVGVPSPTGSIQPSPCFPAILSSFGGPTVLLGPPLRDWVSLGGFEGVVPTFGNETWVNLTPDRLTDAGAFNFTPGAYIAGYVSGVNGGAPPSNFSVQVCSTDETGICSTPLCFPLPGGLPCSSWDLDPANVSRVGCPTVRESFCAFAPPGPDELTVSAGGRSNSTWFTVPFDCCTSNPHALWLGNLTGSPSVGLPIGTGELSGLVEPLPGEDGPPLREATVTTCLASPLGPVSCSGDLAIGGRFSMNVTLGWTEVEVLAAGYVENRTWIDVTGTNTTGTIYLTALSTISGKVVAPGGGGILGAILQDCPIGPVIPPQPGCQALGGSATGSGGVYAGTLTGGPFPSGTFLLEASASGYLSNWTWINASAGRYTRAPPIELAPVGAGPFAAMRPAAAPASSTPGVWLTGRIVDASTGAGVEVTSLSACDLASATCVASTDLTETDGEFNLSVPSGIYELNASVAGYAPGSFYVNATGPAAVALGRLGLTPYPWVAGRVAISPWLASSVALGWGPGIASVELCGGSPLVCGPPVLSNSAGGFNVTGPAGAADRLSISPTGGDPFDSLTKLQAYGSGVGGFSSVALPVALTSAGLTFSTSLSALPTLSIFSVLTGSVGDGSSRDPSSGRSNLPVRWGAVNSTGTLSGSLVSLPASGGGLFDLIVPGPEKLFVRAGGSAFLPVNNSSVPVPASAGVGAIPPLDAPHFGWVSLNATSANGQRIPFATVTASRPDPANRTLLEVSGSANGFGHANVSAPPGTRVTVNVSATDFSGVNATTGVRSSATSFVTPPKLDPTVTVAFVRTPEVNDLVGPPLVGLQDPVEGVAIDGASVSVINVSLDLVNAVGSNGLGQFLLSVPAAPMQTVHIVKTGYAPLVQSIGSYASGAAVLEQLNLTGDGVVAGRVVAAPYDTPVSGANVTACEINGAGVCQEAPTNGAGLFWLESEPGNYSITISAANFESLRTYGASLTTDTWRWLGNLTVFGDAVVSGSVVGLPLLDPVVGANVTLCPLNGSFNLYCAFPTPTDLAGGFSIAVPGGVYRFDVRAPGFAVFELELQLAPGQALGLGTIDLLEDGVIVGTVVDATTNGPIEGASVLACPTVPGPCASAASTGISGGYRVDEAPPGVDLLHVSAIGYISVDRSVDLTAGGFLFAPTIPLFPIGTAPSFEVTGSVVWNATGAGIAAATVSALGPAGGAGTVTVTNGSGGFNLRLPSGLFDLSVVAPGAARAVVEVSVGGANLSGITVRLDPFDFPLSGSVVGTGTVGPLPGSTVSAGGRLATAGAGGRYLLPLPNGSYVATVAPPPSDAAEFDTESVPLEINGGARAQNFTLPEAGAAIELVAIDAASGLAVAGAAGEIVGTSRFGSAESVRVVTDAGGSVASSLPDGSYAAWLNASGYRASQSDFVVNGTASTIVVTMAPLGGGSSSSGGSATVLVVAGSAILAGAAVAVVVLLRRRRLRAPPADPRP